MEKRFIVPIVSMLSGIGIWIAVFVMYGFTCWMDGLPEWLEILSVLVVAILVVFSGIRCRQVGGPRLGNIVRTVLLVIMAIFTFWKISTVSAVVLLVGAVVTAIQALLSSEGNEA